MPIQFASKPLRCPRIAIRTALVIAAITALSACQFARQRPAAPPPAPAPMATAPSPAPGTSAPGPAAANASAPAESAPSLSTAQPAVKASATPPPAPEPVDFDQAIERATSVLFNSAEKLPDIAPNPPRPVMIDPLIDGNSAQQTVASESMGKKIASVIDSKYPKFSVAPFRRATLDQNPLVLIGTLTAINAAADPKARNDLYRICLALVDIRSGKVVAKGVGRATEQTVDATPLPYYHDSPTWVKDRSAEGYIRTCQGTKAGEAADALYVETIPTSMLIDEALRAYDRKDYAEAQRLYRTAQAMPAGEQRRVINGLYLTSWRLHQPREAEDAFAKIVTRGLQDRKLGVRFLFTPASTEYVNDRDLRAQYTLWSKVLAQRIDDTQECVAVVGHTSKTGDPALNDALSLRRAQTVARALERQNKDLKRVLSTDGAGSREPIIGSGTDDLRDALDRRVEFKVAGC